MKENIVKQICKELDITYKELGEKIGVAEPTLRTIASTGKVSEQIEAAVKLYEKNIELEKKLSEFNSFKAFMKKTILE